MGILISRQRGQVSGTTINNHQRMRVAIAARSESANPRAGLFIVVGPRNGIKLLSSAPHHRPDSFEQDVRTYRFIRFKRDPPGGTMMGRYGLFNLTMPTISIRRIKLTIAASRKIGHPRRWFFDNCRFLV
jgi:hypothetical protein